MTTLEQINAHRSIRSYKPTPIPEEDLRKILEGATRASSSGNMQTYSMIVTRDEDRKKSLFEMHFEQEMILQASTLITFCVDWHRMVRWCRLSDADPAYDNLLSFLVGFADAVIAAQNAALAAESLGYGICYMGTTLCAPRNLTEFFELPEGVVPATTLVIGEPNEDPELRARLPLDSIAHHEKYRPFSDEQIRETYHDRETEGWKRYMSFPDLAEEMRTSGVKNLAQVYTQLKYTRENNVETSEELFEVIAKQGFGWPRATPGTTEPRG